VLNRSGANPFFRINLSLELLDSSVRTFDRAVLSDDALARDELSPAIHGSNGARQTQPRAVVANVV